MTRIAVVGGGAWGTALADLLARKGDAVTIWAREPEVVEAVNREHANPVFLPGASLAPSLRADGDLGAAVRGAEVVVSAAPAHVVRLVMTQAAAAFSKNGAPPLVVSVSKGLDPEKLERPSTVLEEVLPLGTPVAVLSGPSFAQEVYQRQPTLVVAAAHDHAVAQRTQRVFSAGHFRVYSHTDVIGVELAGALKNVIALAAGILEGLGLGYNTRAAVITRGLAELTRLGCAMGGHPMTFAGLAGMGDLIATCISPQSRNRYVGEQLGRGRTIDEVIEEMHMVAEGVKTSKVVMELAKEHGVRMPIAREVHRVVHEGGTALEAYRGLVTRTDVRAEMHGMPDN